MINSVYLYRIALSDNDAMMFPSKLFICLTLMLLSYSHNLVTAQCQPYNGETSQVSSTGMTISWMCYDPEANEELQVTYQLLNIAQCDTGDGSQDPPFDIQTTQWGTWNRLPSDSGDIYQHSATLYNLLPYSTYRVSVQARQYYSGSGFNAGTAINLNPYPTTHEAAPGTIGSSNIISTAQFANRLDFQWRIPCSSRNGEITGYYYYVTHNYSGATSIGGIELQETSYLTSSASITGLSCGTTYRFYVAGVNSEGGGLYGDYKTEYTTATTVCCMAAPGMVVNLYTNSKSRTSINIEWNAPSSSCAPPGYNIEYRLTNQDQCEPIIDGPRMSGGTASAVLSKTISGLVPYSTYEVYVYAVNRYGQGTEATVTSMTDEEGPSAGPDHVTNTYTSRNSLSFSWDEVPCGSRHGVIQQYQWQLISVDGVTIALGFTSEKLVTIMSGLSPCTTYRFRVKARNSQGIVSNTWSDDIEAVTTGAVDALTIMPQSATELDVSWTVPSESCITNTEYTIEYYLKNKDQCMELGNGQTKYGTVSGASSTLTGLLPFSTYEVSVRVGMSVATKLADTKGSRPTGFPRNIRALSTTNSSITYSWTEPMCGERNGIIDKYTYTFLKTGSSPDLQHNNVFTSDTMVAFSDLEPYTDYSFIISANTEHGVGPETTFKHRTLEGVPSAPTSVSLETGTKEGSIDIEWETDVTKGVITNYHIRYWKSGETENNAVEIILAAATVERGAFTLTGLELNSTYYIQVQAQTSAGKGPWGNVESVFVSPAVVSTRSSTGLIAGVAIAVILVIIIVIAIIVVYRRRKAPIKETQKETTNDENEIYDEIDAKKEMMAKQQQRSHTVETGYEVNIAMETNTSRAPSDGSAYEDVNTKEEAEYQGLDLDAVNEEPYQDLEGNTAGDKGTPQYANV